MKLLKLAVFTFSFSMLLFSTNVQASSEVESNRAIIEFNEVIIGAWDYTVPGVDPMYATGILHVSKEGEKYVVQIQSGGGDTMAPTEDVEVSSNTLKFAVYVEGERVTVDLLFDGDKFSGSGSSSQGPFAMAGTRKAQPE